MKLSVFQHLKDKVTFLYDQLKLKVFEKAIARPRILTNQHVITLALYKHTQGIPTKKQVWNDSLKHLYTYKTWSESMNHLLPVILRILLVLLALNRKHAHPIKYTDATDISVCLNKNAKYHRTIFGLAAWGRGSS